MNVELLKGKIEDDVLFSMYDYLEFCMEDEDDEEPYSEEDVQACGDLLETFVERLAEVQNDERQIRDCVKSLVMELNELNEGTDCQLIETDQREALCDFILSAAAEAGLDDEEDITEQWREW